MEWISVKDKMPDLHKHVLVYYPSYGDQAYQGEQIKMATHEVDAEFTDNCWRHSSEITHWMELPTAPIQHPMAYREPRADY